MSDARRLMAELVTANLEVRAGQTPLRGATAILDDVHSEGLERDVAMELAHLAGTLFIHNAERSEMTPLELWQSVARQLATIS